MQEDDIGLNCRYPEIVFTAFFYFSQIYVELRKRGADSPRPQQVRYPPRRRFQGDVPNAFVTFPNRYPSTLGVVPKSWRNARNAFQSDTSSDDTSYATGTDEEIGFDSGSWSRNYS
jgi:hypothetical protein